MDDDDTPQPTPPGWEESLRISKAQVAAGELLPLGPLLEELRATAERLEAELGLTDDGAEVRVEH